MTKSIRNLTALLATIALVAGCGGAQKLAEATPAESTAPGATAAATAQEPRATTLEQRRDERADAPQEPATTLDRREIDNASDSTPIVSADGYAGRLYMTAVAVQIVFAAGVRYDPGRPEVVETLDGRWQVRLDGRTIEEYYDPEPAHTVRNLIENAVAEDPTAHYSGSRYNNETNGNEVFVELPLGTPEAMRIRRERSLIQASETLERLRRSAPAALLEPEPSPACEHIRALEQQLAELDTLMTTPGTASEGRIKALATSIAARQQVAATIIAAEAAGTLCPRYPAGPPEGSTNSNRGAGSTSEESGGRETPGP